MEYLNRLPVWAQIALALIVVAVLMTIGANAPRNSALQQISYTAAVGCIFGLIIALVRRGNSRPR